MSAGTRKNDFLQRLQTHVANVAIGSSTLRNQGASNVIKKARRFLAERVDLEKLNDPKTFKRRLNELTERLRQSLPRGARHFGAARKAINIFLRDCFYNRWLCDRYRLRNVESLLEAPLDKYVAKRLLEENHSLPTWNGLGGLRRKENLKYQRAATKLAEGKNTSRVHLDLWIWSQSRDAKTTSSPKDSDAHHAWLKKQPSMQTNPVDELRAGDGR
jgi:hypothetical protein